LKNSSWTLHKSTRSFATQVVLQGVARLGFSKFKWMCLEFFIESHVLVFLCDYSFDLYPRVQSSHDKSILRLFCFFFDLFRVCIDDGVRVWVEPWRWFKFSEHFQAEGAV